ncbi:Uncharacterised protein [Moraxella caviae]|uniref:Uncharacterized protein n=1 Tax=Moraxella caviae TaxID=34060 RepID=A0A378R9G3_9GAMM|nr:Uncharacterised protein [Moraxella caviae]VEW11430.1 Uncharacterised protein [Moraxella caviae]
MYCESPKSVKLCYNTPIYHNDKSKDIYDRQQHYPRWYRSRTQAVVP